MDRFSKKGYTILLVVIGHVLLGLLNSNRFSEHTESLSFIIGVIYSFHMPVILFYQVILMDNKKMKLFETMEKVLVKSFFH